MMNGFIVAAAMLVSSTGGSPAIETTRATLVPAAFTFDLADDAATSRYGARRFSREQSRPLWRRASVLPAQGTTARRFSRTERIIAVAAGASLGWMAGAYTGYAITSKSNAADDVSGLKGMIIGAPIGAALGAVIGYRLTK